MYKSSKYSSTSHTHIISAIIINQLQTHQRKYSAEMHQQKYFAADAPAKNILPYDKFL